MKKITLVIVLICLFIGVVTISWCIIREKITEDQPIKELTEEEKRDSIKIALNDTRVKEEIGNKTYEIGDVVLMEFEMVYKEERISGVFPTVYIYVGNKEQPGVTLLVFIDPKERKVISIGHDYRRVPPSIP
ncbi:MAG: hypothetical protein EFT35_03265 [Methanophagales archaeon ANME-1-THS]|nr:MAG: hypothetical protein EFT35_03265 [Methanophagales archaeon ANME-1-THS]